jgi:chemotaxis family two-component system response regulator Rcp1
MTMAMPTLMIVDDNPSDVDLLREAFTEAGADASFLVARDGVEALALLAQVAATAVVRPSAILLDLNMPRVDGREVLSFIKGTPDLASITTIIFTSSSSPFDREDCLARGADAFVTKPSTLAQLDEFVRRINHLMTKGPDAAHFLVRHPLGRRMAIPDVLALARGCFRHCARSWLPSLSG